MPTPPTAPPVIFNIQGRVPANDLNINQIGNYMRSVHQNLALSQMAGVMSARLKQKVAYRDIMGRETLLQRRQEQLADLSDQIAQYYGEFGSVLNDRALDFLNKQAQINVPTFTSILAGFENARASRADMEKKRLDELERLMNLDAGLQRERMALRKEQLDAQNMVAQAALEGQSKMAAGRIEAATTGLKALQYSGTGHDLPAPQYLSAPYEQQPRIPGLGGLGGGGGRVAAKAAEEKAELAKYFNTPDTAAKTSPKETTGTPAKKEKVEGDVMSEIFGKGTTILYDTGNAVNAVRNGGAFADSSKFAEARERYRTYFKENPDALKKMEEYAPGFTEALVSDDTTPDKLGEKFVEAWGKSEQVHMQNVPGEVGAATKATTTPATATTAPTTQTATDEFMSGVKKGVGQIIDALPAGIFPSYNVLKGGTQLLNRYKGGNSAQQDKKETSSVLDTVLGLGTAHASESASLPPEQRAATNAAANTGGLSFEELDPEEQARKIVEEHVKLMFPASGGDTSTNTSSSVEEQQKGGESVLTTNANAAATSSTTAGTQSDQSTRQPVTQEEGSFNPVNPDGQIIFDDKGNAYFPNGTTVSLSDDEYNLPTVQQSTVQQPTVQQPTVQQPTVQQPTVQQPTVQQAAPTFVKSTNPYDGLSEEDYRLGRLAYAEEHGLDPNGRIVATNYDIQRYATEANMRRRLAMAAQQQREKESQIREFNDYIYNFPEADQKRMRDKFTSTIRRRGPLTEGDVAFMREARNAGYSPDHVVNVLQLDLPSESRMRVLMQGARPTGWRQSESTQSIPALPPAQREPVNPDAEIYEESDDQTMQSTHGNNAGYPESVPAETVPAESVPAETVPAETVPAETVPAETVLAEIAQPDYEPFFDDVNSYTQQQAQPQPEVQAQPETTVNINPLQTQGGYYGDPWYNPDVSGTIQVGTGAENTRVPVRVAAGRLPGDNRVVRLTDGNGNFYDVPASMLGPAQSDGRFTRGQAAPRRTYDDWTVLNAQDRALRDANQLDINLVEDAFTRMYANTMTTPGVGEWYPLPGNPSQNNMAPRFYPSQERQTAPINPEVKAFMDEKMRAMGQVLQKRQQAGQDLHAPITEEEASGSDGTLQKDEVPSVLLNQYDQMQMDLVSRQQISEQQPYLQANAYGNAVWDAPALNTEQSRGNVKPSGNIRTKSGVNLNGINDELMTQVNTLADILNNEFGIPLIVSSGVRSDAEQAALIRSGRGHKPAAPGRSRHRTGDAIDFALNSMKPYFERSQRAKAQYGNFKNFWTDMVRRAGLYQFDPHGSDPFHHTLPPRNKKKIGEGLSIDQMRQVLGTVQSQDLVRRSGMQFGAPIQISNTKMGTMPYPTTTDWGAPEGDVARAISRTKSRLTPGRNITGWGKGPNQVLPMDFTTVDNFNSFSDGIAQQTGSNSAAMRAFFNALLNISAMGETQVGSAQAALGGKSSAKGTFQFVDRTFNSLKEGIGTRFGRGLLSQDYINKVRRARDVFDLSVNDQAILSLVNASTIGNTFDALSQQGAAAFASGNTQAMKDTLVNYILTLHWAGGNLNKAIATVGQGDYRATVNRYNKKVQDFLNFINRRRQSAPITREELIRASRRLPM